MKVVKVKSAKLQGARAYARVRTRDCRFINTINLRCELKLMLQNLDSYLNQLIDIPKLPADCAALQGHSQRVLPSRSHQDRCERAQ